MNVQHVKASLRGHGDVMGLQRTNDSHHSRRDGNSRWWPEKPRPIITCR